MHPFLLSVFIFCIYFELIFKMKSVDNTSANPRISIAGNAVPKKIEELVDYVVVHELAHRKEMNHSNAFWNVVEKYMPDYKERRKKLREYHIE